MLVLLMSIMSVTAEDGTFDLEETIGDSNIDVTVDYDAGGSFSMDATGSVIDTSDSIL